MTDINKIRDELIDHIDKALVSKAEQIPQAWSPIMKDVFDKLEEMNLKINDLDKRTQWIQDTFAGGKIIGKEGTAAIPQRFYKYDLIGNTVFPMTSDWYLAGAAVLGNKIWVKNLSTAGTVKWLYCLQSTSTNLRRIMIF